MRWEALGLLAAVALSAPACSTPTARDSAAVPTPTASSLPVAAETAASVVPTTGLPTTAAAPVPSTGAPTTVAAPPSPVPAAEPGLGGGSGDPVFESGSPRRLQISDLPVDNAEPGSPGVGRRPHAAPAGWAAFDAALSSSLIANGNTAASVAVSIDGDVVHAAAFGTRVPGTFTPVAVEDRFRVASISKTLTAVTLLQLVEEGVVGLDEPVGGLVAAHIGVPRAPTSGPTVRQLLTHTTGWGKYYSVFFRNGANDCRHAAAIGLGQGGRGGGYRYSNMNYCVAGLAIEALTGTSYEAAVYERLLTPLGISGMRLAPTFDPGPGEAQHVSTWGRNYMETLGAAGAWIASPSDLVSVLDALDPTTPGWKPLEDPTLREMLTPTYGEYGQRGYGMGMILYGDGRYGHTGTIENTHAMMLNRGDGVIWSITVAGPSPSHTPALEGIIDRAFEAGGFVG